ncbi:MAG: methyltransferase domain-containing protein [Candidatus Woesearchaeota archaeon]|nr:methyltransferase domain-containing protein [Candidatus Woesearchaeota archaeon]
MPKEIANHSQWGRVAAELAAEDLKLASYDRPLLELLGDVSGRRMLDYGAGPGVLATALRRGGAQVRTHDISPEMNRLAGEQIGHENVYHTPDEIPQQYFDDVICNLVLCIIPDEDVPVVVQQLRRVTREEGTIYNGFCNPMIFDVPESQIDFRKQTGHTYCENHQYAKTKKEGGYEILEEHRPLEWYQRMFQDGGLTVRAQHFTPQYTLHKKNIQDFVIFELGRNS